MSHLSLPELRSRHPRLVFAECNSELHDRDLVVTFHFILEPELHFRPQLTFHNVDVKRLQKLDPQILQRWLVRIGIVESLSYWKAACPAEIVVEAGYVAAEEFTFWEKLRREGLSEFFYVNKIDGWANESVTWRCTVNDTVAVLDTAAKSRRTFLPIGGGKDSVVSLELLKKQQPLPTLFTLNTSPAIERVCELADVPERIRVSRTIDPQLLELNKAGYLNGHTPFSALLAFVSTAAAFIYDYQFVALSNEWSANEGNIVFDGHTINHQYSKSLQFEQDFRAYVHQQLSTQIQYFSVLRPLHELQIARLFSAYPQYFPAFVSCNRGSKQGVWCGHCPKCLFAACMLAPFLPQSQLQQIFGKDMFADASLWPILQELAGAVPLKSLECVGTRSETLVALKYVVSTWPARNPGVAMPVLLQRAQAEILRPEIPTAAEQAEIEHGWQHPNFVPAEFLPLFPVGTSIMQSALAHSLRRYEHDRILVLGFGREGKSTLHVLQQLFPEKEIAVMDETTDDPPYLQNLNQYDVIFKTAGIPIREPALQAFVQHGGVVTSQLNEFLRVYAGQTVGVTGTKGKSTTSSLIAHLLKTAGRDVLYGGNIGIPSFDLASEVTPQTTVVLEMSSYQLETAQFSPHWAVLTSFYPEHLNYHGNLENYLHAKARITQYQSEQDLLFFESAEGWAEVGADSTNVNGKKEILWLASQTQARLVDIVTASSVHAERWQAAAAHLPSIVRQKNVPLAVAVAQKMGLSDEQIEDGLAAFLPLPHRLEKIGPVRGITFIDDTLATIPEASCAALDALDKVDVMLLGGQDRGISFTKIVEKVVEKKVPHLIFFPPSGKTMEDVLSSMLSGESDQLASASTGPADRRKRASFGPTPQNQLEYHPTIDHVTTMEEAVRLCYQYLPIGGTVLLSPASPSYGGFKNYEDKSQQFVHWIHELGK